MMKIFVIALVACAAVSLAEVSSPEEMLLSGRGIFDTAPKEETTTYDLLAAAKELHRVAPTLLQEHSRIITKHAALLQEDKAKAYKHNFNESKKAIAAALKNLHSQLQAGHKHDIKAVAGDKKLGNGIIDKANAAGNSKCNSYKKKACPAKQAELKAKAKKDAAARAMHTIGNVQVCRSISRHTFGDMDIDKAVPAYGSSLRNSWDKTRAKYVAASKRHAAATKVFNDARRKYQQAIASFNTALRIEANNAYSACHNAHKEFNALVKDVQSNVSSRKQVWIASLVVTCYVDHITSNSAAKSCADRKRRTNTSRWNIHAGKLQTCHSKAALTARFGPAGWHASTKQCHHSQGHWKNFKQVKEAAAKEKHKKHQKERKQKEGRSKELTAKEKAAKKKEKGDKAKAKENKAKADERRSKELQTKERSTKEKNNKEKNSKANHKFGQFTCNDRTVATQICMAIANKKNFRGKCNGNHWNVGQCGRGVEVNVDPKRTHNCSCSPSANSVTFRPCIHNHNWGGFGKSCSSGNYNQRLFINCGGFKFAFDMIKHNPMKNACSPMQSWRSQLKHRYNVHYVTVGSQRFRL